MSATNPSLRLVPAKLKQAIAYHQKGQFSQAQELYKEILKIEPRHFDALHLLGVIAAQTKNPRKAVELIGKAIEINPTNAGFFSNLGNAFKELEQYNAAVANYDKAIALRADYAEAYWNKALVLLLSGDLDKGLAEYEWRWKRANSTIEKRNFAQPRWLGKESLVGKTILLYGEQGLGDTVQFCRYAKLVADLGARVILEVQKPLMRLLANLDGVALLVAKGSDLPGFDYQCPLLSLPLAFKTNLNTIPFPAKYLSSEASGVAKWQARLGDKTAPRIGLVWSGSTWHINDHKRSILLADLIKHLPAEYQYVSLQKEVREVDMQFLQSHPNLLHFGDELNDFGDTASLCDLMDIVISVDTSVAHLSGALGKPTWILLPFSPDWRWLLDRIDSPWYQTAKLYRQEMIADWGGVFERVKADLIEFVKKT